MKIKNIIFDLGKVITDITFKNTAFSFAEFQGIQKDEFINFQNNTNIFDDLETGAISPIEFRNEIRSYFNLKNSDKEIDSAWNSMLNKTKKETLEMVNKLRPQYKTFLLSNTNPIHIDWVNKQLFEDYKIKSLSPFFDKAYFSYNIGYRKPSKEAFLIVLNENNLIANETIFIDDKHENLIPAKELGIHVYLKKDEISLKKVLNNIRENKNQS